MKKWVTIVEGLMVGDRKMTIGYIRWCFGEFVCKFKVFQGRGVAGAGWGAGGLGGGPLVQSRVVLVVYKKQEQIYTTIMA